MTESSQRSFPCGAVAGIFRRREAKFEMNSAIASGQSKYRWLVAHHGELDLYGLPRRFPWPKEAEGRISPLAPFRFDLLREAIRSLLEETPDDPAHAVWQGFLKLEAGIIRFRVALEDSDFDRVCEILADMERIHACPFIELQRAFVFEQQGRRDDAIACYRKVTERAPKIAAAWRHLVRLYVETDRKTQAISCCWRLLEHIPSDPAIQETLASLGVLIRLQRDLKDPNSTYYVPAKTYHNVISQRCRELISTPGELLDYLDSILDLGTSHGVPLEALEWVAQQLPAEVRAQINYGVALRLDKRQARAALWLRDTVARFPAQARAAYELAEVLFQTNRETDARELVDRALKLDPNFIPALIRKFNLDHSPGPEAETQLLQFAAQSRSWAAYLEASRLAHARRDLARALEHAGQGFLLGSDQDPMLLYHSALLEEAGEDERLVAALKPKVDSHRFPCELAWRYAQALQRLKLTQEATAVLLRELNRVLPADWRQRFLAQADLWQGTAAESEVPLERYPSGALQRSIALTHADRPPAILILGGQPLPVTQTFSSEPLAEGAQTLRLALAQGLPGGQRAPLELGSFTFHHLIPSGQGGPDPDITAEATATGVLRLRATQGTRRLAVTWSA